MNARIESLVAHEEKAPSLELEVEAKKSKEKCQSDDQEMTCNLDYVKQDLLDIIKFLSEITSGPGIYSDPKCKMSPDEEKFFAEFKTRRRERHDYLGKLYEIINAIDNLKDLIELSKHLHADLFKLFKGKIASLPKSTCIEQESFFILNALRTLKIVIARIHDSQKDDKKSEFKSTSRRLTEVFLPPRVITIKKAELGEQIPKTLHYHWYGKPLPVKYFHNIMQAHFLSPDFKIMLFTNNPEKIFDVAERNLENFSDNIRKFIKVMSLNDLLNDAEKYFSADMMKHIRQICFEECTGLINYAGLSDLTRLISLWLYGGAYLDTDLVPTKKFTLPEQKREEGFITVSDINNCILSVKHHPAVLKAIVEIVNNYVKMRKIPAVHATSFFKFYELEPGDSFDDDLAKLDRNRSLSILDLKRHPNKLIQTGYYSRKNLTVKLSGPTVLMGARFDYGHETNTTLETLTRQEKMPTPRISKERARLGNYEEVYNFGEIYAFCDSNWVGDERADALREIKTTPSVTTRRMSI